MIVKDKNERLSLALKKNLKKRIFLAQYKTENSLKIRKLNKKI